MSENEALGLAEREVKHQEAERLPNGIVRKEPFDRESVIKNEKDEQVWREFEERAFNVLENLGYIEVDDNGDITCDVEKFKEFGYKEFFKEVKEKDTFGNKKAKKFGNRADRILVNLFWDREVYAKGREDEGKKPLILIPEDKNSSININEVKEADFHMGLFDLQLPLKPDIQPTLNQGWDSGLSFHEVALSYITYNKNYGDGIRDENGKLMVKVPDSDKRYPVTSDLYIKKYSYRGAPDVRFVSLDQPVRFLHERTARLLEAGLFKQEDFKVMSGSTTAEKYGTGERAINYNGIVFMNGLRFHLPRREYGDRDNFVVRRLTPEFAAVIDKSGDKPRVDAVFSLTPSEVVEYQGDEYPHVLTGNIDINNVEEFKNMSSENFAQVENFEDFLEFSDWLSQNFAINTQNYTLLEQSYAIAVYNELKESKDFKDFIDYYGENGLMALMSMGGNIDQAELVFEIAEKSPERAEDLFFEVADIFKMQSQAENIMKTEQNITKAQKLDQFNEAVIDHSNKLLLAALPVLEGKTQLSISDVHYALRSFKKRVSWLYTEEFKLKSNEYDELLKRMSQAQTTGQGEAVVLDLMREHWKDKASREDENREKEILAEVNNFYKDNEALFQTASETTGDTQADLEGIQQFIDDYDIRGVVLDAGSGPGGRITEPMAKMLEDRAQVIGLDLVNQFIDTDQENLAFVQGDLTKIPLPDQSVDAITMTWSILNELVAEKQQDPAYKEFNRVLKKDGVIRADVAHLEGEGGWLPTVEEYRRQNANAAAGEMFAQVGERSKHFNIAPKAELEARFKAAGFQVKFEEWKTKAGKPRLTIIAQKVSVPLP